MRSIGALVCVLRSFVSTANQHHRLTCRSIRILSVGLGGNSGSEPIGVRDQVGGLDCGSTMADLIQEMHSSPAIVLGSSPPQRIGVGQAIPGKQAVAPEPGQHSVAFFVL